jgi:hypothetical protein
MSQCPEVEKKDIENLFSNRERENRIESMSLCARLKNKDSENLFFE